MDIRGLGYTIVETTDLAKWQEYGTQVLGLMEHEASDDNTLYLKMDERNFRIAVVKSDRDGYGVSGWEVAGPEAFAQAVSELEAADVETVVGSEEEAAARMVQALVKFNDPDGNRHEIYWGPVQDFKQFISPVGVTKFVTTDLGLGHTVLPTPSFETSREFYTDVLGFGMSDLMKVRFTDDPAEPEKRLHFLHVNNGRHHSLAIFECPIPSGCVHMMLEVEEMDDVGRAMDRMEAHGVQLSATLGKHTNDEMVSFYMKTPGGFDMEYGCGGLVVDWDRHTTFESSSVSLWGHDFSAGRQ
ncbi:biphenyl 2,3-dioxygenase [Endozoicomonas sp. OPT23]|uniref:VOC family protein n=1 Tax=Endozoicomonas sp. OPT23 TaxID=2072845 RepID=UPI00129A4A59|nr:VOC family protein [Endozoicomonas sp. OPT23]MRI34015.1 biphenyl 2,3-dioxygenase [Endozoicomonas sp. OPT23]